MLVFLKDAGDLLMQSFFPVTANKSGPVFHRKNELNMNLGVTICHAVKLIAR
jgi:hypothetical protein